ncbi:MAG: leucine-rich repeat protein [Clostridia bacterium]|nr:leucine-rich repeat protein [Clostridia bacterium]
MKKRILLTALLVMLLACLFVLCASAVAYDADRTVVEYTDASGVTHEVPVVKYDDATPESVASSLSNNASMQELFVDDSALVVLKATDGTLTAYPTWYIIEPSGSSSSYVAVSEVEYTYVNSKSGKTYERGATLYVEFPEGMTHLRNNGVWGRGTHYEKNVTEIAIPKSVTVAQSTAFNNNTTLKKVYIREGSLMTAIEDYAFENCSALEYFQFESLTKLTLIDGFANDKKLGGELDLSKNTALKTIGNNAFLNTLIGKVTLPDSVESIGTKAFCGANFYFASPYLPRNLTTLGNEFLSGTKNLNSLLIFPEGITSIDDEGFSGCYPADSSQTFTLVFLGKMTKLYIDGHTYVNWGAQTNIYFAQNSLSEVQAKVYAYTDKQTGALGAVIVDNSSTGTLDLDIASASPQSLTQVGDNFIRLYFCSGNGVVETSHILTNEGNDITEDRGTFVMENHTHYGAQLYTAPTCGDEGFDGVKCIACDTNAGKTIPATGNHTTEDDGNCETEVICSVCQNVVTQALSHVLGESYTYEKGFTATGIYKNGCTNEGCTHGETTEIPALVTSKGYSQDTTSMAVVLGLTFNKNAIEAYGNYLGKDIYYGLVASKTQSDLCPLMPNGEAKDNSVKADFTGKDYSIFQLKITGIDEKDEYFHCCGYLIIDEEVSYVNAGEISSTALEVSYNNYTGKKES